MSNKIENMINKTEELLKRTRQDLAKTYIQAPAQEPVLYEEILIENYRLRRVIHLKNRESELRTQLALLEGISSAEDGLI